MENLAHEIENEDFRQMLAERIQALANPTRIHILHTLMNKECCVHEIAQIINTSQANISKHLSILYQHGFVTKRRVGSTIYYNIGNHGLKDFCEFMCGSLKEHLNKRANAGKEGYTKEEEILPEEVEVQDQIIKNSREVSS